MNIKIKLTSFSLGIFLLCLCYSTSVECQTDKDSQNPLNIAADLMGWDKSLITELHNGAKHPLVEDNNNETVYLITTGSYQIYTFDNNNKVKSITIKFTRENHYLVMQMLIQKSEWEYSYGDDIARVYKNPRYSNIGGVLMKEQEPGRIDATYFFIQYKNH